MEEGYFGDEKWLVNVWIGYTDKDKEVSGNGLRGGDKLCWLAWSACQLFASDDYVLPDGSGYMKIEPKTLLISLFQLKEDMHT